MTCGTVRLALKLLDQSIALSRCGLKSITQYRLVLECIRLAVRIAKLRRGLGTGLAPVEVYFTNNGN